MIDDYDLIEASFLAQYGIRLRVDVLSFDEFLNYCSGLMPDTPLGGIISIRSEDNKDVLKGFTKEQHRIRNEWRRREAKKATKEEYKNTMDALFAMALA